MFGTYAVVDPSGKMVGKILDAVPSQLESGLRLSVRMYYYDDNSSWPREVHYHHKGYEASVESKLDKSNNLYYHSIEIIGSNLIEIKKAIEKFNHIAGAVDRDLDFPLRYSMPEIRGFWKRIRFILWDYPIHGRVEPKEKDSDEDECFL